MTADIAGLELDDDGMWTLWLTDDEYLMFETKQEAMEWVSDVEYVAEADRP